MVCYGSFSYIESDRAERLLSILAERFPNVKTAFIGNYPDMAKCWNSLATDRVLESEIENEVDSPKLPFHFRKALDLPIDYHESMMPGECAPFICSKINAFEYVNPIRVA